MELLITPGHGSTEVNGIAVEDKKAAGRGDGLVDTAGSKKRARDGRDQSDGDGTFQFQVWRPGAMDLLAIDDGKGWPRGARGDCAVPAAWAGGGDPDRKRPQVSRCRNGCSRLFSERSFRCLQRT